MSTFLLKKYDRGVAFFNLSGYTYNKISVFSHTLSIKHKISLKEVKTIKVPHFVKGVYYDTRFIRGENCVHISQYVN